MELAIWTALVVVALVVVLWSFLRPRRREELEHEEHLPLADEHPPPPEPGPEEDQKMNPRPNSRRSPSSAR